MAALGHLAPVTPQTLDDLLDSFPPEYAELAADVNMPLHLMASALWRIFGTNEVSQRAAQFEMQLVARVLAWPDCIYSANGLVISRTEWKRFDDLIRDRHVRRVRPAMAAIEYPAVGTLLDIMLASAQLGLADNDAVAHVNIVSEDLPLDAISNLVADCRCQLALTINDDLCHPANHLLSLADNGL